MNEPKYHFYGKRGSDAIQRKYHNQDLPDDVNDDPEILRVINGLEAEPQGKSFKSMVKQFQKNKWYGFVMYSLNGREIVKFHFMYGVIVRKEVHMWADGWSFQDLKDRLMKISGVLVAIPEAVRSSINDMVSMKRNPYVSKEEYLKS